MFKPAGDVKKYLKIGLWGNMKSGKTKFALSFPKAAIVDTEKGSVLHSDDHKFDYMEVIRWRALGPALGWLKENPGKYETLIVDSVTPLYADLVEEVGQAEKNRTGRDFLSQLAWGIVKRRFRAFLRFLLELPMHVVVTSRAKDEYEQIANKKTGEHESVKTGDLVADVDRALHYDMDFIFRCQTEVVGGGKKAKSADEVRYTATCTGTRRKEIKLYQTFDLTDKSAFETIFSVVVQKVMAGAAPAAGATTVDEVTSEARPHEEQAPRDNSKPAATEDQKAWMQPLETSTAPPQIGDPEAEHRAALGELAKFGAKMLPRQHGPMATAEDLKVLFTRAGQVAWPDGAPLKGEEGKELIAAMYGIESSKELMKPEVDELYELFGKVLSGAAVLERNFGDNRIMITIPAEIPF
jgi:hypothetical protein